MLTIEQKAKILAQAGLGAGPAGDEFGSAAADRAGWEQRVNEAYVAYSAARAARSLREAETARNTEMLRRMAWSSAVL
ncbi:hypothetical protein PGB34_12890 [Xenophilus arseniciresistens]|uniref:Uncharacterized protein n=1 Tax=Xenophilus arseniciresistens TaxID=1283306 RepID=A0AAE3SZM1_9BURK|nr:hypothetical protein [Xenophilus arseniciresistens]MDA7417259.1 hypothetical protein [Xenophilus arseniciresistens]